MWFQPDSAQCKFDNPCVGHNSFATFYISPSISGVKRRPLCVITQRGIRKAVMSGNWSCCCYKYIKPNSSARLYSHCVQSDNRYIQIQVTQNYKPFFFQCYSISNDITALTVGIEENRYMKVRHQGMMANDHNTIG